MQHLFAAIALPLAFYTRIVWPLNMVLLGLFSVGVFADSTPERRRLRNVMAWVVVVFPLLPGFVAPTHRFMFVLSLAYVAFFVVVFVEVLRFLLRPRYIDADIVSAAIAGYLLLLETGIFLMQALYYAVPDGFHGIDTTSFTTVYLDLVYFCSIVITSIGFGDITPAHHVTKLATSLLGVTGQMYSVVLVGILISKYASSPPDNR